MASHIFTFEISALLVDLRFCTHHDARNTKATLQASARSKCIGVKGALGFIHAFKRGDVFALGLRDGVLAADLSLAVNHDGATAALSGGGATVFRGCDVQFVSQSCKEMWMLDRDGDISSIDLEGDAGSGMG
jgi:hypothetical protein